MDEKALKHRKYSFFRNKSSSNFLAPNVVVHCDICCSDSCILLRTLISTSNANQVSHSNQPGRSECVKKPATFSPQILVVSIISLDKLGINPQKRGRKLNSTLYV